jgi:hypothetical protein
MTRQQILLTCLNEGSKVEESEMIGIESKLFFLQGLKPELAHITGTKRGINPLFYLEDQVTNKTKFHTHKCEVMSSNDYFTSLF